MFNFTTNIQTLSFPKLLYQPLNATTQCLPISSPLRRTELRHVANSSTEEGFMRVYRGWLVVAIFALVATGVFIAPAYSSDSLTPGEVAVTSDNYWAPWVTKTTINSATINWRGENLGAGTVEYAKSSFYEKHQKFQKKKSSRITGPYQHVQLTGLEPNTSYVYRVRPSDNADVFSNRTFRTMPVKGPFTFIVISDSQEGHNYTEEKRFKYVADAIAKEQDVLFILHGGDYAGHDSESLWAKYFKVADPMLAKFPIFTTIGNHEYHNEGGSYPPTAADQYHWSYDILPGAPLNHFFDCAGIRFIILDSPDPNNTDSDDPQTSLALAESQASWLESLLDNKMRGTFTMHHHPIWDYGRSTLNPDLQPWETLYHTYGISANFAGHTHNYQRYSVEGITYFIVGTAGGRFADINAGDPYAVWYQFGETRKLGYLKVTVDPTNNVATAKQIFVASVKEDDSDETPHVYDPPVIAETVTFPLRTVYMSNAGWAIGNDPDKTAVILHTDNGGKTWEVQGDGSLWKGHNANDISAVDKRTAWAALGGNDTGEEGMILHTKDGGKTWKVQALPQVIQDGVKGIKGVGRKEAWAVGLHGPVMHTNNGGKRWEIVPTPGITIKQVNRMDVLGKDIWIADFGNGENGMIHSPDGGRTWRQEYLPGVDRGHGPMTASIVNKKVAWTSVNLQGELYRTMDGGLTWKIDAPGIAGPNDIDDVCAVSADEAWAVQNGAAGYVMRVKIVGNDVIKSDWTFPNYVYEGVSAIDKQHAWIGGYRGMSSPSELPRGSILHTSDGGNTWVYQTLPVNDVDIWKLSFVGARR